MSISQLFPAEQLNDLIDEYLLRKGGKVGVCDERLEGTDGGLLLACLEGVEDLGIFDGDCLGGP